MEQLIEDLLTIQSMTHESVGQIADFALESAVRCTHSKLGYIAFTDDNEKILLMHAWSKSAMEECAVAGLTRLYQVKNTGLWGEAVRQRKPVITNDYISDNPLKKGLPEGHCKISRHMNVPIFYAGKVVAILGVGNKEVFYDETDVHKLTLLGNGLWLHCLRNQTEQKLQLQYEEVQRSNAELEQFAYVASHDLKAPLRAISNLVTWIIEDQKQGKDVEPYREMLNGRVTRMENLINGLLELSRIGRMHTDVQMVDTGAVVNEVMVNIGVDVTIKNSPMPFVHTNYFRTYQVFANVIDNAIKHHGVPVPLVIEISYKKVGRYYEFRIYDNGQGIDKAYHNKIFQIFQTLGEKQENTGIGLAMMRKIVTSYGGEVRLESEPGKGSTFIFTLPGAE